MTSPKAFVSTLPSLKKNQDGSLTIYMQNDSPGTDKESNWLPAPDGAMYDLDLKPAAPKASPSFTNVIGDTGTRAAACVTVKRAQFA
jgi:hypothetical protein